MTVTLQAGDALLIVDVQADFVDGRLAVPRAAEVIPALNEYIHAFSERSLPVVASRDWHPANHHSFRSFGGAWPEHCVAGTAGAAFAAGLELPPDSLVVSKATQPDHEAYSAFDGTALDGELRALGVRRLFVGGLATDYCVVATVLGAIDHRYEVVVLEDAIRAVDVRAGDGERALRRMAAAGARLLTRPQVLEERAHA